MTGSGMQELSFAEVDVVSGGVNFEGRRTSTNVVFHYSLDQLCDEYGLAGGLAAWVAQGAGAQV